MRAVVRRIQSLSRPRTRERNLVHAARSTETTADALLDDLEEAIHHHDRRIARLEREALALVTSDEEPSEKQEVLCFIRGCRRIGKRRESPRSQ